MIGTTKSTAFAQHASSLAASDPSWYGTLGVLAASLAVVAMLAFSM
jgi:hypothetical protein